MSQINVGALSSRDEERRDLITSKCWKSKAVQSKLRDYKCSWLCDGKRLAWSVSRTGLHRYPRLSANTASSGA